MNLDSTKSVRAYLGGAITTNQPEYVTSWKDHQPGSRTITPGGAIGLLNSTTPVTLIAAASGSVQREPLYVSIFNADTVNVTVTLDVYDGANGRRVARAVLEPNWTLTWEKGGTWHVYDENGVLQGGGGAAAATLTVEEVDGSPSLASITTLQFHQGDGFVVSQPVAGTARVNASGTPAPDQDARIYGLLALMGF